MLKFVANKYEKDHYLSCIAVYFSDIRLS
jgi:hypothetical protein